MPDRRGDELNVGALVAGRFLLEHRAGRGGMGTVFRAVDRREGGELALKVLRGDTEVDVERFVREATILAGLDHPNIVRYTAHGRAETGEHYLAMEWLEGEDLGERLSRSPLTDAEALAVATQTAAALDFAHARGAVHRDIKPSNLFLRGHDIGRLAVLDFGIAGLVADSRRLTQTGVLLGTPGYIAPEQVERAQTFDARSDIFSLGCVLFECLTGRPAFDGHSPMAVLAKLMIQEPPSVCRVRPSVAPALDALVSRLLARNPAKRPQTAMEVIAAIEALVEAHGLRLSRSAPAVTMIGARPPSGPLSDRRMALGRGEQRLVTLVLAGRPYDGGDEGAAPLLLPEVAAELCAVVEPLGGHLTALAGGALMITVWAPGTAVDRAARAARCALAVRARFADVPSVMVTGRGQIASRVVDGNVIDRGVGALDATRPGTVRLDEATAGMLAARFDVDRDGDGWLLGSRARGASIAARPLGGDTSFVGRNREIAMLEGIFAGCVDEQVVSTVLITGAAGAGKSRLRLEFVDKVRRSGEPLEVLVGRADALGRDTPFAAVADLLRRAAGMADDDPPEVLRAKLTARVARRLSGPMVARVASFLGEMIGIPFPDSADSVLVAARADPPLMIDAMRAAWEEWLIAECRAQPVMLALEDLQWSDDHTARLIDSTLRDLRDLPLMVVGLMRLETLDKASAAWIRRDAPTIKLGPLHARASDKLARELLGDAAGEDVVNRLIEQSGGNPFYLNELIRAAHAGSRGALPDSVLGIVEARLDAEGSDAKRALRAASVFGHRFPVLGVAELIGGAQLAAAEARRILEALAARELVAPVPDATAGATEYVFCHDVIREAAYMMLTDADRALGHQLATRWLEQNGPNRIEHAQPGAGPAHAGEQVALTEQPSGVHARDERERLDAPAVSAEK